jgi:hypothetical protein
MPSAWGRADRSREEVGAAALGLDALLAQEGGADDHPAAQASGSGGTGGGSPAGSSTSGVSPLASDGEDRGRRGGTGRRRCR